MVTCLNPEIHGNTNTNVHFVWFCCSMPPLINSKLINDYKGIFDISYNNIKIQWIKDRIIDSRDFDPVEVLTIHIYNADIEEKKGERSMESVKIINIKQQSLHSLEDYLSALKMITSINSLSEYIKKNVIP